MYMTHMHNSSQLRLNLTKWVIFMTHLYLFVLVHGIGVIHYENFSYFSTLNLVNVHLHELDERCTLINSILKRITLVTKFWDRWASKKEDPSLNNSQLWMIIYDSLTSTHSVHVKPQSFNNPYSGNKNSFSLTTSITVRIFGVVCGVVWTIIVVLVVITFIVLRNFR